MDKAVEGSPQRCHQSQDEYREIQGQKVELFEEDFEI